MVYHSAAKVGDWGTWGVQADCIDATANLGRAAAAGVGRFLHISSTSAYGHPAEGGPPIDESAPLGQNIWWPWDDYTLSKVESERILWRLAARAPRLTVIRPSWLYGERDRTTTARLVGRLRAAAGPADRPRRQPDERRLRRHRRRRRHPRRPDPGSVAKRTTSPTRVRSPRPSSSTCWPRRAAPPGTRNVPYRVAYGASLLLEAKGRLPRQVRPPLITRYATWLMGRDLEYSTDKAETRLGWKPAPSYRESIERTVRWYLGQDAIPGHDIVRPA